MNTLLSDNDLKSIRKILAFWYAANKRELPWRDTSDAYKIWLSEIILQQTRVNQGLEYYFRFIDRWPDLHSLATAKEDEVLKEWQGLGYYSRARNLHVAAINMDKQFKGCFPIKHEDIICQKGIGSYTAAAICSFAYNQPYAVVDGNVFRVLSRIFGISTIINSTTGKKEFETLANRLLDQQNPALHNQALMEFGALQCTPASPNCNICPLHAICIAFNTNDIDAYPQKKQKTPSKNRYFNYFYITENEYIYLHKRNQNDIWKNLYELPLIETTEETTEETILASESFLSLIKKNDIEITDSTFSIKHILSHQNIMAKFISINISNQIENTNLLRIKLDNLEKYPISRLTELFIERKNGH